MNVVGPLVLFGKMMLIGVHHLLGPLHLPPLPRGPAPALRLEVLIPLSLVNILATMVLKVVF